MEGERGRVSFISLYDRCGMKLCMSSRYLPLSGGNYPSLLKHLRASWLTGHAGFAGHYDAYP